jgi:hypothetical protein
MKKNFIIKLRLTAIALLMTAYSAVAKENVGTSLRISLQQRIQSDLDPEGLLITSRIENWKSTETAIIICDMWDKHWCNDATARVAEIAPAMNQVLTIARDKGVKIVHAPSDCLNYYANHPGRKEALK